MHLILLLQESPQHSAAESLTYQSTWNDEFANSPLVFTSFLSSIVGRSFSHRKDTFQILLEKCDDDDFQQWKYSLLLLRIAINVKEFSTFDSEKRNEIKVIAKSE